MVAAIIALVVAACAATVFYSLLTPRRVGAGRPVWVEPIEPPRTAELLSPVEIALNVTAEYSNPFDPEDINVTAFFASPSGKVVAVPAFYYQEYERSLVSNREQLTPRGAPQWRVRFTPTEVGSYKFYVEARDRWGNRGRSGTFAVEVQPSNRRGFVRVHSDGRYFAFDDGSSAFFVGLNVCWSGSRGTFDYEEWFEAMARAGVNLVRIWMAPWCFGIEWDQLGRYNLREAWRLDYVLRLAEKYDIYVVLCLMNHGQLSTVNNPQWGDNPYNRARGGPLSKPEEFWTSEEAKELFKKRLRYIVARWGYSTHILSWELWNEVDLTDNYDSVRAHVAQWHREMAAYLKAIDPYDHLVTTSFANPNLDPVVWSLEEIDFVTIHRYGPEGFQNLAVTLHDLVAKALEKHRKPVLVTEFGIDWRWWGAPLYYQDGEGVGLHDGLWAAVMAGSPATAMSWWWDNYIHPYNLYYHFRAIAEFLRGVQPAGAGFRRLDASVILPEASALDVANVTIFPSLGWARPDENYFTINLDGTIDGDTTQIPAFIQGKAHPHLRNNPTFKATFPRGGRVVVRVNSVSSAGAYLVIYVDGEVAKRMNLRDRDGRNDAFAREYDMEVEVEIPPGVHEIRIDNIGSDWYTVDYIRFEGAVLSTAKLRVFGLTNGTLALAWVKNIEHNWWNLLNNRSVEPVRSARVVLRGLMDGRYKVELFDTRAGLVLRTYEAEVEGGTMTMDLEGVYDDLALRVKKVD